MQVLELYEVNGEWVGELETGLAGIYKITSPTSEGGDVYGSPTGVLISYSFAPPDCDSVEYMQWEEGDWKLKILPFNTVLLECKEYSTMTVTTTTNSPFKEVVEDIPNDLTRKGYFIRGDVEVLIGTEWVDICKGYIVDDTLPTAVRMASSRRGTDKTVRIESNRGELLWTVSTSTNDSFVDTLPDSFNLPSIMYAYQVAMSPEIIVTGMEKDAPVYATNGVKIIKNGGSEVDETIVTNGDRVKFTVRRDTPQSLKSYVTIGELTVEWHVSFEDPNALPAPFSFQDVYHTPYNTQYTTPPVVLSGIIGTLPLRVEGGEYRVNSGGWTTSPVEVKNGDVFLLRVVSGNSPLEKRTVEVTVGRYISSFSVTTTL